MGYVSVNVGVESGLMSGVFDDCSGGKTAQKLEPQECGFDIGHGRRAR